MILPAAQNQNFHTLDRFDQVKELACKTDCVFIRWKHQFCKSQRIILFIQRPRSNTYFECWMSMLSDVGIIIWYWRSIIHQNEANICIILYTQPLLNEDDDWNMNWWSSETWFCQNWASGLMYLLFYTVLPDIFVGIATSLLLRVKISSCKWLAIQCIEYIHYTWKEIIFAGLQFSIDHCTAKSTKN